MAIVPALARLMCGMLRFKITSASGALPYGPDFQAEESDEQSMRAHVVTFGCQMNEYDTHAIQSELAGIGYSFVDDYREADLVLVNTCAVRGKPVEKAQTLLGELRKEKQRRRGAMTIGLMGCLAQLPEGRRMGEKFAVDIMLGPGAITEIVPAIERGKFQSFDF